MLWCGTGVMKRDPILENLYNGIQSQVASNSKTSIYTCLQEEIDNILKIVRISGKHMELYTR